MSRHGSTRIARLVLLSAVTPFLVQTPDNPGGVDRSNFDQIVEQLTQDRPHVLTAFGEEALRRRPAELQRGHARFDEPTLIIHGTSDATVPSEVAGQRAAAAIPGARLIEYEGALHRLFYTERDRVTADLLAFIGS